MDELRIIDGLFSLLLLALGAVLQMFREQVKDQRAAHDKLNEKVDALRNTVSKDYMPRSEVASLMADIKGSLQRIEDKLGGKMDKK